MELCREQKHIQKTSIGASENFEQLALFEPYQMIHS